MPKTRAQISDDQSTKLDRRIKKKRLRMRVHAKSVFTLKTTIAKKAQRLRRPQK